MERMLLAPPDEALPCFNDHVNPRSPVLQNWYKACGISRSKELKGGMDSMASSTVNLRKE